MAAHTRAVEAPPGAASSSGRDPFLDLLRAVATVRVVVWHMFAAPVITYVVAAMPAMFFVSGDLLAGSFDRRDSGRVVADRLRRVALPLWAFAACAWAAMALQARVAGDAVPWSRAVWWIVPLADPHGTTWEGGWLSSHLWFVRALVWLLLLSPWIVAATRRWGGRLLVGGAVVVVASDLAARHAALVPTAVPRVWWSVGDLALYGTFLAAGIHHRMGGFAGWRPRRWLAVAVVAALGATAWRLTQPVPGGVVNDSHPMHLLVGAAWLALACAGRAPLTALARGTVVARLVRTVSRRSLTIYLWHTAVLMAVLALLRWRPTGSHWLDQALYVGLAVVGIAVAMAVFGWLEDVAARRQPRVWPVPARRRLVVPVGLATLAAVVVVGLRPTPVLVSTADGSARAIIRIPTVPSRQPPAPTFGTTRTRAVTTGAAGAAKHVDAPVLGSTSSSSDGAARPADEVLASWLALSGMTGVVASVLSPSGDLWRGALGTWVEDGVATTVDDRFDLMSATKLITGALVLQAVDRGLVDLDAPLPGLLAAPRLAGLGITPRQLLTHTSGLPDYHSTTAYEAHPDSIDIPALAIDAALDDGFAFAPGEGSAYSSTNYLVLGLLLEQVTGSPYDQLVSDYLLAPLELVDTAVLPAAPAAPRTGAAGVVSNVTELVVIGEAILREHLGLSTAAVGELLAIDPATGFGTGSVGFCPCEMDTDGTPSFQAIGYFGSSTIVGYVPDTGAVVVVVVTDTLFVAEDAFAKAADLVDQLGHSLDASA